MKKSEIALLTKRKLAQALKSRMAKQPFDKITVQELLDDADITRSTFYYHFEDVYDLLKWMFDTELLTLLEKSENCVSWDDGILLFMRYLEENRKVCLCAYNSVGREMLQRLFMKNTEAITRRFVNTLAADIPAKPEHVRFITEFYTMALVSTCAQWLKKPEGRTPEDMIALLHVAVRGSVEAALKRSAGTGM